MIRLIIIGVVVIITFVTLARLGVDVRGFIDEIREVPFMTFIESFGDTASDVWDRFTEFLRGIFDGVKDAQDTRTHLPEE